MLKWLLLERSQIVLTYLMLSLLLDVGLVYILDLCNACINCYEAIIVVVTISQRKKKLH